MQIQKLPLEKLNPAKYNPRKDLKPGDPEYEKLKKSMETFGYVEPIVWNKQSGHVVSGHQRLKILQHQGETEIECVVVDLDETEEKALNVALNKISGEWDLPKLADLINELDNGIFDISLTGFDVAEIEDLFSKVHDKDVQDDDFDVDEALKEPVISKPGDLWLLGRHRLLCGDSTKAETYEKLMDGKKANLVVTDPPYGVSYDGGQGTIKNDDLKGEAFYEFLFAAFTNMEKVMANDASIYIFHADTKGLYFRRAFEDAGFHLSGVCQWVKQSLVLGRAPYQFRHEPILFGFKKKGKHKWYAGRAETTVWEFDKPSRSELHSTMKPIPLIAYPIKNSSAVNAIVVDPFSGSASTLIACEQIDRICYAIELVERFVDVGVKRYIEYIGSDEDVFLIRDGEKILYKALENPT
ncbi:MAG: site-specific DNA-methyltransferase [Desulfitobacteriaceae bacterium]|nr:site-specific DNA-methyltransferase [Desulfitobacteriaceae bacterium]